jgi:Tfp pilus assembly protein PilE
MFMKRHAKRWEGRNAVGRYLIERSRDERGFSIIELAMYLLILSVLLSVSVLSYQNMRTTSLLNDATIQIKVAMDRAFTIAKSENQRVTLSFWSTGDYPNCYNYTRAVDTNKEVPAAGISYTKDPTSGVYYIKLLGGNSGVTIASNISVVFDPQGTVMLVTPTSVVISYSGKSRTIAVAANGEVSY